LGVDDASAQINRVLQPHREVISPRRPAITVRDESEHKCFVDIGEKIGEVGIDRGGATLRPDLAIKG
jgi:hypothetical protein